MCLPTTFFSNHSLIDFADEFIKEGGTHLYIDEIHKYAGWSRELKQIYDMHPSLNLIFTGSSVLDIKKGEADLSRRALMYMMQGLSFREYLQLLKELRPEFSVSTKYSITRWRFQGWNIRCQFSERTSTMAITHLP